mgnify:FL=1
MRISIFGSGYVGLVEAAVFSKVGHQITCMDIDPARIERIQGGDLPFYKTEQKLEDVIKSTIVEIREEWLKRVLRDQTVRNADKASTAKNKNSPIAISACLSVNSTPAKK